MDEEQAAKLQLALDTQGHVVFGSYTKWEIGQIISDWQWSGVYGQTHPFKVIGYSNRAEFDLQQVLFGGPIRGGPAYVYYYRCITD